MNKLIRMCWKKYTVSFMIIILLSIVLPVLNNIIPKLSQELVDEGIILKNITVIVIVSSLIIISYGLKYLFNTIVQSKIIDISLNTISNIKKDIISSTVNRPMIFHDQNSSEYLLSRINEVDNLSALFSADLITFLVNLVSAITAFILIANKNFSLAILTISLLPIFLLVIKKQFKKINEQICSSLESSAKTNEKMYSVLKGTQTLKQFNEEDTLLNGLNVNIDNLTTLLLTKNLTLNKNTNVVSFFTIAIQTFLVGIAGIFIAKNTLSIGDYISLSQYISLIYIPVLSYQTVGMSIKPALISLKRLKYLNSQNAAVKKEINLSSIHKVEVSDLCFQYNSNVPVIEHTTFSLQKGDKLLLTGPNGCGKSTLVKLLLGFYQNYSGTILFDGIDLKSINEQCLREKIAIVPQSCYLFDTTLIANIKIANNTLNEEAFLKKIDYLKSINLFDEINLDTKLVENGKNLSGGEVQRISLARILIRDFDICIFDEITNSLDVASKIIIKNIIKKEFNDKICIFISHDNYLKDLTNKTLSLTKNYPA